MTLFGGRGKEYRPEGPVADDSGLGLIKAGLALEGVAGSTAAFLPDSAIKGIIAWGSFGLGGLLIAGGFLRHMAKNPHIQF